MFYDSSTRRSQKQAGSLSAKLGLTKASERDTNLSGMDHEAEELLQQKQRRACHSKQRRMRELYGISHNFPKTKRGVNLTKAAPKWKMDTYQYDTHSGSHSQVPKKVVAPPRPGRARHSHEWRMGYQNNTAKLAGHKWESVPPDEERPHTVPHNWVPRLQGAPRLWPEDAEYAPSTPLPTSPPATSPASNLHTASSLSHPPSISHSHSHSLSQSQSSLLSHSHRNSHYDPPPPQQLQQQHRDDSQGVSSTTGRPVTAPSATDPIGLGGVVYRHEALAGGGERVKDWAPPAGHRSGGAALFDNTAVYMPNGTPQPRPVSAPYHSHTANFSANNHRAGGDSGYSQPPIGRSASAQTTRVLRAVAAKAQRGLLGGGGGGGGGAD